MRDSLQVKVNTFPPTAVKLSKLATRFARSQTLSWFEDKVWNRKALLLELCAQDYALEHVGHTKKNWCIGISTYE